MVLIIDNYDSFTYNIYQALSTITDDVQVVRNDRVGIEDLLRMDISHLVISPGPGRPEGARVRRAEESGRSYNGTPSGGRISEAARSHSRNLEACQKS